MRTFTFAVFVAIIAIGCGTPAPPPETTTAGVELDLPSGFDQASETIVADNLLTDVSRLASDEFEGRGPGSEGDRMARAYLAGRLAEMGFEPLFDGGSYEQPVEIVGLTANPPESWTFSRRRRRRRSAYRFADEYMIVAGVQEPEVSITDAEVVFVGYGIVAPEEDWDDFKGADLEGKILLMLNDDPDWDPELFAGEPQALLRPLGLQIRQRRPPGRRRRHHRSHHLLRRLPVDGRALVQHRRTVRARRR